MGRPSKRDELVAAAAEVFSRRGFRTCGMTDLIRETGVSRMTVYNHFPSKDDLVVAALRRLDEGARADIRRRVEAAESTPAGRLRAFVDVVGDVDGACRTRGCVFMVAAAEHPDPTSPVRAVCREHKRLLHRWLTELAGTAGAAAPPRLARQILLVADGLRASLADAPPATDEPGCSARAIVDAARAAVGTLVDEACRLEASAPATA